MQAEQQLKPYFRSSNPDDPICQIFEHRRRDDYELWRALLPQPDDREDAFIVAATIAPGTGHGETYVYNRFVALWVLDQLPQTKALFETLWHLDFARLIAIGNTLDLEEDWGDIDAYLCRYLTPKKPEQALPSARQIAAYIRRRLGVLPKAKRNPDMLVEHVSSRNHTYLGVMLSDAAASMLRDVIIRNAEIMGISQADAVFCMLMGVGTKVTVNVYQDQGGVIRTARGDAFTGDEATVLRDHISRTRPLEPPPATKAYRFTEKMRAFIQARDGHCRFPGCSTPHYFCDIDHVHEFDRGGETAVENAQLLCRRHHNLKTSKQIRAYIGETAEVTWQYPDGSTCVTLPEGVLER
ncbi:HNH endonuclease signature motif containing protein [Corynebacterium gerontici]|uniref:HNH nuclease domain-containing protein n=1 Tax=Corynebacterium gerontici TaxID=2079234 RepID=A0A3G6J2K2_9CORY|nr:HNH endonuclease signature motif containing protein [Corynebacterium gerontici]AZA11198.1 hypothetical protein CGERO_04405 [Corynebacterium gerontici]